MVYCAPSNKAVDVVHGELCVPHKYHACSYGTGKNYTTMSCRVHVVITTSSYYFNYVDLF